MGFESYKGSLRLGAGLKPDGDGGFALMESCDIQVSEDGKMLDAALEEIYKTLKKGGAGISEIKGPTSDGLIDTYTIVLTDGRPFNFTVKNADTTIIDGTGESFNINDVVDLVLGRLPRAEEVGF